jgi:hypothetical protein
LVTFEQDILEVMGVKPEFDCSGIYKLVADNLKAYESVNVEGANHEIAVSHGYTSLYQAKES